MFSALFTNSRPWRWLLPCAAALGLVACGGGDGGGAAVPAAIDPPTIQVQPQSASVQVGAKADFTVGAVGDGTLTYQWQRNGVELAGATTPTYSLPSAALTDHGAAFAVVVSNAGGSVTSSVANLAVTAVPLALPAITGQPSSTSVQVGETATFTVVATGGGSLAFQWLRDGIELVGATAASYSLPSAALTDDGAGFSVAVSNAAGSVGSSVASLAVTALPVDLPVITAQPGSVSVQAGQSATFTVAATARGALTYQWKRNGVDIGAATAASYTTPALAVADSGARFSVVVASSSAAATSSEAVLTVTAAPLPAVNVVPVTIAVGSGYSLAVRADGSVLAWGQQMPGGPGAPVAGTMAHLVNGIANARAVSATNATGPAYAIRSDGSVMGWGDGRDGLLGVTFPLGAATLVATPMVVAQLSRTTHLGGGGRLSLDADGSLWAFPVNSVGAISAVKLAGIGKVQSLSLGCGSLGVLCHYVAIDELGSPKAVYVVDGPGVPTLIVSALAGWPKLTQMRCAPGHCLAVDTSGNVWAQGNNFYGELGDGTNARKALPVRLTSLAGVKSVALGLNYSYAITTGGALYSWGDYFLNARDDRIATNVPVLVPSLAGVQEISVNDQSRLVRLQDGTVWGWGSNLYGELGSASPADSYVPVQALGINLN